MATELQTAFDEANLSRVRDHVVVPPAGIRSRGQKHDGEFGRVDRNVLRSGARCGALLNPRGDLSPIRRIAPDALAVPSPRQAILPAREILRALRVLGCRADIEREVELSVEFVEQVLGRGPVIALAAEHKLRVHGSPFNQFHNNQFRTAKIKTT